MTNSENLADHILTYANSLADLLIHLNEYGDLTCFDEEKVKIFAQQARKIRFKLIQKPGLLIYIKDEKKRITFETAINFIWGQL